MLTALERIWVITLELLVEPSLLLCDNQSQVVLFFNGKNYKLRVMHFDCHNTKHVAYNKKYVDLLECIEVKLSHM